MCPSTSNRRVYDVHGAERNPSSSLVRSKQKEDNMLCSECLKSEADSVYTWVQYNLISLVCRACAIRCGKEEKEEIKDAGYAITKT